MTALTKLRAKRSISALDLRALIKEMKQLIVGGVIINVYMIGDIVMLKIRCNDGATRILATKLPNWICISSYDVEKPAQPPTLCRLLRKYLRRTRITAVDQVGFDRIVNIKVEGKDCSYELIIELVREGNLVLCGPDATIIATYREVEYKDRALRRGLKYQLPPNTVLNLDVEKVLEAIKCGRKKAFYAALALVGSPELAYEVLARSSISPDFEVSSDEEVGRIVEATRKLLDLVENPNPNIVYVDGKPFSVVPVDFVIYSGCEKKSYSQFYEAVAEFFYEEVKESLLKGKEVERERAKVEASIREVKLRIAELEAKVEGLRRVIDFLKRNYEDLQGFLDELKEAMDRGVESACKPKIEGFSVLEVDRKARTVKVGIEGVELTLKPCESLMSNISSLYGELKSLKRKLESSRKALVELDSKLTSLIEEEKKLVEEAEEKIRKRREQKYWYEKYLWFKSSEGFLVVAGKDAAQNEVLVKKYLEDRDLFFHADIVGAATVIVKSEGREVPLNTIVEAAQYAACYSKAWKAGFGSIDVYWVYGEQVSKTPPSGEYLPKGSFMIRGTRNYLRGVELKLAVGLMIINGDVLVVSGPPSAIAKQAIAYVLLVPGDEEKGRAATRIAKIFNDELKSTASEKTITVEDVLKVLPHGPVKMIGKGRQ
ncbi:MAG: ribosome rescue protein RqcH [Candidatus Nezhaarchaeales archaeon]